MKKKLSIIFLSALTVISLTACGSNSRNGNANNVTNGTTTVSNTTKENVTISSTTKQTERTNNTTSHTQTDIHNGTTGTSRNFNDNDGDGIIDDIGRGAGDIIEGAGDIVGDVGRGVETVVSDIFH